MDMQVLVATEELGKIASVTECLRLSDTLGLVAVALIWDDECMSWQLIVASTLHQTNGPLSAYKEIQECYIREDTGLRLDQISSLPANDPLPIALTKSGLEPLREDEYYRSMSGFLYEDIYIPKLIIFFTSELAMP